MKRIIWGIVKIAFVVGLLVWISYKFFPETFNGAERPFSDDVITEELTEEDIVGEIVVEEETPVVQEEKSDSIHEEPTLSRRERYARYTQGAGTPEAFRGSLTVEGTAVLSTQIAQAFGEPIDNWSNLSDHKKTFWVLYELVKHDINVDMISSLQGAKISVQNGSLTFSFTTKATLLAVSATKTDTALQVVSRTNSEKTRVLAPLAKHLQANPQSVVPFPSSPKTSTIYWNAVLEMNNVDGDYKKRPVYQDIILHY